MKTGAIGWLGFVKLDSEAIDENLEVDVEEVGETEGKMKL